MAKIEPGDVRIEIYKDAIGYVGRCVVCDKTVAGIIRFNPKLLDRPMTEDRAVHEVMTVIRKRHVCLALPYDGRFDRFHNPHFSKPGVFDSVVEGHA